MKSCQITTSSKEHFNEVFTKLRMVGFVYSDKRCKIIKEIDMEFGYYPIISIFTDFNCKMVLHGSVGRLRLPNTTIDEFLSSMKTLGEA